MKHGTMGRIAASIMPALDAALKSLALAYAGNIHKLAWGKAVNEHPLARFGIIARFFQANLAHHTHGCDIRFFEQLNPGKTKTIKAGDQLNVPNVEPFEVNSVKDLKVGSEIAPPVANDIAAENEADDKKDKSPEPGPLPISVKIDMKTNMLGVFDTDKLVAAYPVTIGSAQTASPISFSSSGSFWRRS